MTAAQHWALIDRVGRCVGEFIGPTKPKRKDTPVRFHAAVAVDRRGDMMVENLVVDRATGTGRWVADDTCRQRAELRDRLDRMDRVEFLEFVLAEARAARPPSSGD